MLSRRVSRQRLHGAEKDEHVSGDNMRIKPTLLFLIAFHFLATTVLADTPEMEPSRRGEQFVLSRVASGEVADLQELPNPADRVLSSELLVGLLTNGSLGSQRSIVIAGQDGELHGFAPLDELILESQTAGT